MAVAGLITATPRYGETIRTPRARDTLRRATSALHAQLHASPINRRLAAGILGTEEYLEVLRATELVYRPHEGRAREALQAVIPGFLDCWPARWPDLVADIHSLGGHPAEPAPGPGSIPARTGAAVGILYVLEGSLLGGQAIWQRLSSQNDWADASRLRFHGIAQTLADARWAAYAALLEPLLAGDGELAAATAAAKQTFADFLTAFRRQG